uniref:Uncharacterized protein n=1 Tax=viral metagenome TaxID=1070528 RepID=A0A6C0DE45_9ZZZZ
MRHNKTKNRTIKHRTINNKYYNRLNKKNKKNKKNKNRTRKLHILKSTTPRNIQSLSTLISSEINHKGKGLSSYSPTINEELVSLKSMTRENILGCNNDNAFELRESLEIEIPGDNKCVPYYDERAKKLLLHNLSANKHVDVSKIITPKQNLSNCWFNTMFVTFFISDKGRKFFHYFRQLMILGELSNGKKIPRNLADAFALLNFAIDSCLTGSEYAYDLDNNSIIEKIYKSIPIHGYNTKGFDNLYNVNDSGNPVHYYSSIIHYLQDTSIDLLFINTYNNTDWKNTVNDRIKQMGYYPHIIVIEINDELKQRPGNSGIIMDKEQEFTIRDKKYVLDSCAVRDKAQNHFCGLITCEGKQYAYDGESYHRLVALDWKRHINSSFTWTFEGTYDSYGQKLLEWSFLHGYQMLIYYLS